MTRVLRPYQRGGIDRVRELLQYNPLLVSPTGSGKTFMLASLVEELRRPTWWIAHRRELIDQAHRQLCGLGLRAGVVMAGEPENRFAQVQVASVQTLARRRVDIKPEDLVIIDEAHHASAASYSSVFGTGAPVVGCTATPFRLDGAGLGDMFRSMVVAATPRQLVDAGVLVRPRVLCPPGPSMDGVRIMAGEFNQGETAARMDKDAIVGDIVETWKRHARGGRTLVFAVNIAHSQHIAQWFNNAGVPAAHVDGDTEPGERDATLARLRSGELRVVSNVQLLTEGWDLPALDVLVVAKPTNSLCLHQQMVGRVVRMHDGKDGALVLDHAGNHLRHGEIIRDLQYSLEPGSNAAASPRPGVRTCLQCYCMFPTSQWVCPQCGFDATPPPPAIRHVPGDLREFMDTTFEGRQKEWARLVVEFPPGDAEREYRRRFGSFPVLVGRRLVNVERAPLDDRIAVWNQIDLERVTRGYERGWTDHQYKAIFGGWPTPDVRTAHSKVRAGEFADRMPARQWGGKARVAGAAPSKAGAAANPYSQPVVDKPWMNHKLKPWVVEAPKTPPAVEDDGIPF